MQEITYAGHNRLVAVGDDGIRIEAEAAYVIDASGQQAISAAATACAEPNPSSNFGSVRLLRAGDLQGAAGQTSSRGLYPDGWFWFIPLKDGTTSVGAVVDARRFAAAAAGDPGALYWRLIEACEPVAQRLRAARLVGLVRVIRDYSYCSQRFYGPGYLLAGDAACFIDPVFSTGVHLACMSGYLAFKEPAGRDPGQRSTEAAAEGCDSRYRAAFERYLNFLYFL